ncbi:MAG TPA: hypothetical protein VGS22_04315 [Thermoanaerobaculia bacterium]|jgi:addiction module HigA family antidote|nr:hypothetical protein [Thermoanaerobaculia bacterium]
MLPENRILSHPGEILQEQFLQPLGLTQVVLSEHLGIPVQRINEIVVASAALPLEPLGF